MTISGDPLAPDSVLAALRGTGVFRSNRLGAVVLWQPYNNGMPDGVMVTDIETTANGQIIATTFGRGAFRLHSGTVKPGVLTARGRITSFEEEREGPPSASNPIIVTLTLDSQPDTVFTGESLSGTARTLLRNAFSSHRIVTITFRRTSGTSAQIIRVLP
jgi:hypothetical protein